MILLDGFWSFPEPQKLSEIFQKKNLVPVHSSNQKKKNNTKS